MWPKTPALTLLLQSGLQAPADESPALHNTAPRDFTDLTLVLAYATKTVEAAPTTQPQRAHKRAKPKTGIQRLDRES